MAAASAGSGQREIFEVDQERAAEALCLTWGELYQDIGVEDGRCGPAAGTATGAS